MNGNEKEIFRNASLIAEAATRRGRRIQAHAVRDSVQTIARYLAAGLRNAGADLRGWKKTQTRQ